MDLISRVTLAQYRSFFVKNGFDIIVSKFTMANITFKVAKNNKLTYELFGETRNRAAFYAVCC